jgi:hypothetical protein
VGAIDLGAAAAAGMVVSAATVVAVLVYALACWTWPVRTSDIASDEPELATVIALPVERPPGTSVFDKAA